MDHNYSDVRQCFTALRVASLYGNCEIETESGNFCTTFWHSSSLQVHIFFFRTNYLLTYISVSISVLSYSCMINIFHVYWNWLIDHSLIFIVFSVLVLPQFFKKTLRIWAIFLFAFDTSKVITNAWFSMKN